MCSAAASKHHRDHDARREHKMPLDDTIACIAAMEACMTSRGLTGLKVFKGADLILKELDHGGQDVHGFLLCRFGLNALGEILHHERTALQPLRTMMIVLVEQVSSPIAQNSCRRHLQQKKYQEERCLYKPILQHRHQAASRVEFSKTPLG